MKSTFAQLNDRTLQILLLVLILMGCTQPKVANMGSEDGRLVADLVDNLNEFNSSEAKLASILSKPGVLTSGKIGSLEFYIVGKPTVDGEVAKARVSISKLGGADPKEQEWSFRKVDGNWKIENAPL